MKTKLERLLVIGFTISCVILYFVSNYVWGFHHDWWKHVLFALLTAFSGFCGLIVIGSFVSVIFFKGKNHKILRNWIYKGLLFGIPAGYIAWQISRMLQ